MWEQVREYVLAGCVLFLRVRFFFLFILFYPISRRLFVAQRVEYRCGEWKRVRSIRGVCGAVRAHIEKHISLCRGKWVWTTTFGYMANERQPKAYSDERERARVNRYDEKRKTHMAIYSHIRCVFSVLFFPSALSRFNVVVFLFVRCWWFFFSLRFSLRWVRALSHTFFSPSPFLLCLLSLLFWMCVYVCARFSRFAYVCFLWCFIFILVGRSFFFACHHSHSNIWTWLFYGK